MTLDCKDLLIVYKDSGDHAFGTAEVLVDGEIEKVHVKNTGRCKELLIPNARVFLEEGRGDKRKTKYSPAIFFGNDFAKGVISL